MGCVRVQGMGTIRQRRCGELLPPLMAWRSERRIRRRCDKKSRVCGATRARDLQRSASGWTVTAAASGRVERRMGLRSRMTPAAQQRLPAPASLALPLVPLWAMQVPPMLSRARYALRGTNASVRPRHEMPAEQKPRSAPRSSADHPRVDLWTRNSRGAQVWRWLWRRRPPRRSQSALRAALAPPPTHWKTFRRTSKRSSSAALRLPLLLLARVRSTFAAAVLRPLLSSFTRSRQSAAASRTRRRSR
mmetsp:Transcript_8107/g.24975  ORF Transcript_8107/g.24975 Transcript_8107/m.24975 type:complete len:247 (+) Transcript_8107:57-797(+)